MAEELESATPDAAPDAAVQSAPPDKVKTLFDALTSDNFKLGTIDEFRQKMTDPGKAGKLYDALTADNYHLGGRDEFVGKMSPQKPFYQDAIAPTAPSTKPAPLSPRGQAAYKTDVQKKSDRLLTLRQGYNDLHPDNKVVAPYGPPSDAPKMQEDETPNMLEKAASAVDANVLRPTMAATNTMVYGTLHGAYQISKDTYKGIANTISQHMTGKDMYDNADSGEDIFSSIVKNSKAYAAEAGPAKSFLAETTRGVAGALPIIGASMIGGEAAAVPEGASWLSTVLAHSVGQALKLGGILGGTEGAQAYGESRENSGDIGIATRAGLVKVAEGTATGLSLEFQNMLGASSGNGIINKLTEAGFMKGGKLSEAAIRSAANATVFGAAPVIMSLSRGEKPNYHEAIQNAATGLAFSIPDLIGATRESVSSGMAKLYAAKDAQIKQDYVDYLTAGTTEPKAPVKNIHGEDEVNDHIVNRITHDPNNAEVLRNNTDDMVNKGLINDTEHKNINDKIDTAEAINSSVPESVEEPKLRAQSVGLISQRNELDNRVKDLEEEKGKVDESFHEPLDAKIERLEAAREEINEKIKDVATGEGSSRMPLARNEDLQDTPEVKAPEEVVPEHKGSVEEEPEEQPEEYQKVLNNSTGSDTPREYVPLKDSKVMFNEAIEKFKGKTKQIFTRYQKAVEKKINDLEKSIGKSAGRNANLISSMNEAHLKDVDKTQQEYEKSIGKSAARNEKTIARMQADHEAYRDAVNEYHDNLAKAKAELLDGVRGLLGKIGKNASVNIRKLIPDVIRITSRVKDEASLNKAMDIISKHIDDIYRKEGETTAKKEAGRLSKTAATFKGVDPATTEALQALAAIGKKSKLLSDPHDYTEFARSALDRNGNLRLSTNEIWQYVAKEREFARQQYRQKTVDSISAKLAKMEKENPGSTQGVTADELFDDNTLHGEFFGVEPVDKEEKPTLSEVLTGMIKAAQYELYDGEDLSLRQRAALKALKNIDPDGKYLKMSVADKKILNFALHNINENGSDAILKGTDPMIQFYLSNEIHTAMEHLVKDAAGSYFNWMKQWGSITGERWGQATRKIDVKGGVKARTPVWVFRQRRDKVTFRLAVKALNPNSAFVNKVYQAYFEPFENGYSKAKEEIARHSNLLLHANEKNDITREDASRIRIYSILSQFNRSSPHSEDAQFEAHKQIIAQSMKRMDEVYGGTNQGQFQRQAELIQGMHESGLYDMFVNHSDEIYKHSLDNDNHLEDMLGITERHMNVIRFMDAAHEAMKPKVMELYEKMGVDASDVQNYTHMDYLDLPYETPEGMSTDQKLSEATNNFFGKSDITNLGPHVTKRVDLPSLPKDKIINLDHTSSFQNGTNRQLMTAHTISSRMLTNNLMADSRTNLIFDATMEYEKKADTNARFMTNLIKENMGDALGMNQRTGKVHWLDAENVATVLLNDGKKLYYRATLGSGFQYVKQYAESGASAIAMIGDLGAFRAGLRLASRNTEGFQLMHAKMLEVGTPVLRRFAEYEDQHTSGLADQYTHATTGYADLKASASEHFDKLGEALMNPLKRGDAAVSIHTWNAAYLKMLKQQGIIKKYRDFNLEFIKNHELDKNAVTYANDIVERTNAKVEGVFRARFLKSTETGSLRSLFVNMKTFQLHANVEARLAMRNVLAGADSKTGMRQVVAYVSAQAASGIIKALLINPIRTAVATAILSTILGSDDFHKYEQQQLAKLQKGGRLLDQKTMQWYQEYFGFEVNDGKQLANIGLSTASDILAGQQDNITQGIEQFTADFGYRHFWVNNLQNKMDKAGTRPSLFYTDENFFGYGAYQGIINGVVHPLFGDGGKQPSIVDQMSALPNAEDKWKLGLAQGITTLAGLGLGADAAQISQRVNMGLQTYLKNAEYTLPNYYGPIKQFVKETGIAIKPINIAEIRTLNLHDMKGEPMDLTGQQIQDLDKSYAEQLNRTLNLTELKAGRKEAAHEAISTAKKDALEGALDKVLGSGSYKVEEHMPEAEKEAEPAKKWDFSVE